MEKRIKSRKHREERIAAAAHSKHVDAEKSVNVQRSVADVEQASLIDRIDSSQRVNEKRQSLQRAFDDTAQRQPDEEELQGKFEPTQRQPEEEELLQGDFAAAQRQPEEEELMQGKFETLQRQEEDELQMVPAQLRLEEESVQDESAAPAEASQGRAEGNRNGMPDQLRAGVEALAGVDMSDVRVHENSAEPARINAHAYAQGTDIHLAPGQAGHLPHEAWHVAQQKQGRVSETRQLAGKPINDDPGLEREADVMGAKATAFDPTATAQDHVHLSQTNRAVQRKTKRRVGEKPGEAQARKDLNRRMRLIGYGLAAAIFGVTVAAVALAVAVSPPTIIGAGFSSLALLAAWYKRRRAKKAQQAASEHHLVTYGTHEGRLALDRAPAQRREALSQEWIDNLRASRQEWQRRQDMGLNPDDAQTRIQAIDKAITELTVRQAAIRRRRELGEED